MNFMTETAAASRELGIKKLGELAEIFKADWVVNNFMPKLYEVYNTEKQGYLYRMCCINSMHVISSSLNKDQVT